LEKHWFYKKISAFFDRKYNKDDTFMVRSVPALYKNSYGSKLYERIGAFLEHHYGNAFLQGEQSVKFQSTVLSFLMPSAGASFLP
jgi:hypothetical protein